MNATSRTETMQRLARLAAAADDQGDVVMRTQHSNAWRDLATDAEAARAPEYLTWWGRTTNRRGEVVARPPIR